ncbi:MAG TPA: hydrogenase maturation protease [Anaerolineales bacterium]|nr:hydrogenase maturation protease [Anaerolineales bacterium]
MKTVVVGLGNPILGDDGVGWRIVEYYQRAVAESYSSHDNVDFICLSVGGLSLMEHMAGYDRAILLDAVNLGKLPPGDIYCLSLADLPNYMAGHTGSAHDTSLATALQLGIAMGISLPEEILVIGVESPNVNDFSEQLSPPVEAAIPRAAFILKGLLRNKYEALISR